MKTGFRKSFCAVLILALLLSCTAMPVLAGQGTPTGGAVFHAYPEWQQTYGLSSHYQGILVDGTRGDFEIGETMQKNRLSDAISFGVSYSGEVSYTAGVNPMELHMNAYSSDGAIAIAELQITTGGQTYVMNYSKSSRWLGKDTAYSAVWGGEIASYARPNGYYFEWRIALSQLRLERVAGDTDLSTDLTVTAITGDDVRYTKSGRLVLHDILDPGNTLVQNYVGKTHALFTDAVNVDPGAVYNAADSSVSMTASVDQKRNAGWAVPQYRFRCPGTMAWEYSLNLTVPQMPDIGSDPLLLSANTAQAEANTPALVFYFNDADATGQKAARRLTVGVFNRGGTLFVGSCVDTNNTPSNEVSLGVGLGAAFDLRLIWLTNGDYAVFVNGQEKGTVNNRGTDGNSVSVNSYLLMAELHGGNKYAGGAQQALIRNLTVKASSYGLADALLRASAKHLIPAVLWWQTTEAKAGVYSLRLIATVDRAAVDAGQMTVAGFEVTAEKTTAAGEATVGATKRHETTCVYSSILADGQNVQAPDGTYFLIFTVNGIPAEDTLTLRFRTFAKTADSVYTEGGLFTLTLPTGSTEE